MDDALPVPVQNEYFDDVPESFNCPICFHLPRKMFQCKRGHWLCCSCHKLSKICPSCKVRFDQKEPIRILFFESELDRFVKVNCAYRLNGCKHKPTRNFIQAHQSKCYFNFERFGKLMNVFDLIGYKDCDFRFNTGKTDDAMIHYASFHDCLSVENKHMQMELTGFREAAEAGADENCLWTPIISNLKDKNRFLLTSAIFNGKHGALYCFSIVTSKLNEYSTALTMEYKLTSHNNIFECGYLQSCIPLSEVESLPNKLTCFVLPQNFKSYFTDEGSLLINCILQESNANSGVDEMTLERIRCTKRTTSLDVQLPDPRTEVEAQDETLEKSEDSTTGCNETKTRVSKEYNTTEIFVSYLPEVTTDRITAFFAKFGDVTGVEMYVLEWEIYQKLDRHNSEGPKSCLVKFSDTSAVAKVMERKRNLFWHVNGKKRRLKVNTTEGIQNILTYDKQLIGTEFLKQADQACTGNRDAVFEYIQKAFSHSGDPVVWQYITRKMTFKAASYGTLESLKYCIEKGVDVNLSELHSHQSLYQRLFMRLIFFTVLDTDKKIGYEKMEFLSDSGANFLYEDCAGSLIHFSVVHGSVEMLKFFLEKKLDANHRGKCVETPLLLALNGGAVIEFLIEKVKLLLDYGADIDIPDKNGRVPWDFVQDTPYRYWDQLEEMFRKRNCKLKICPELRMLVKRGN